jgi:hypothetical protein
LFEDKIIKYRDDNLFVLIFMSMLKRFCFLHPREIEAQALSVLSQMAKHPLYGLNFPLDTAQVAEFLGLDLVWEVIPEDEMGIIAAMILPLEKLIEVNEIIQKFGDGFVQSTIGHEIGHWVLHIDQEEVARCDRLLKKGIKVKVQPLLRQNNTGLQGREWQAQYFAGCLLMPEYILIEKSKNKDLTKWTNLYTLAEELGVTISNLIYRLRALGWLKVENKQIYLLKY